MSSPSSQSVRQRSGHNKKRGGHTENDEVVNGTVDHAASPSIQVKSSVVEAVTSDWEYKVALAVITILALATRFYGITHPNQVVFDEVHFGKVSNATIYGRTIIFSEDAMI